MLTLSIAENLYSHNLATAITAAIDILSAA
jgi:hypothetical protein